MPAGIKTSSRVTHMAAACLSLACGTAATSLLPGVTSSASATPAQDKRGTWTLQGENDAITTLKGTSDQYYTSGLRFNWTSGTDTLPAPIAAINKAIWGDGVQRISLGVQQMIFTPRDTQLSSPWAAGQPHNSLLRDRPYSSLLLGTINLINDTDRTRSVLVFSLVSWDQRRRAASCRTVFTASLATPRIRLVAPVAEPDHLSGAGRTHMAVAPRAAWRDRTRHAALGLGRHRRLPDLWPTG